MSTRILESEQRLSPLLPRLDFMDQDCENVCTDIAFKILSYMSSADLNCVALVSKRWHQSLDNFYSVQCLAKGNANSWRIHYQQKRALEKGTLLSAFSHSYSTYYGRSILIDQTHAIACLFYRRVNRSSQAKAGDYAFEIWDVTKDRRVKTILSLTEERVQAVAFAYPYLLTKAEDVIYIRDVSSEDFKFTFGPSQVVTEMDNFSLIPHENGCRFGYTKKRYSRQTSVNVTHLFRDGTCRKTVVYGNVESRIITDDPITLLCKHWFIHTMLPGTLLVHSLVDKEESPSQLHVPKVASFIDEKFDPNDQGSLETLHALSMTNRIMSLIANDHLLVAKTDAEIIVWDLISKERCRCFSINDLGQKYFESEESSSFFFKLDALVGDLLFVHGFTMFDRDLSAGVIDLANGALLRSWDYDQSSLHPISFYHGKTYVIEEGSAHTLSVYK